MCAPDMLHPFQLGSGLTMTYHDLPTAVYKMEKRSESFQDMMRLMNNWLAQIRTLHYTHAKIVDSSHCQLSRVTFHVSPGA